MNKKAIAERRHFGRRWTQVHGWILIEGRPRMSCVVQNFSETGALLEPAVGREPLPKAFVLVIDAIKFRIGCEVARHDGASVGVRFVKENELSKSDMVLPAADAATTSYQRLLALVEAEQLEAEIQAGGPDRFKLTG